MSEEVSHEEAMAEDAKGSNKADIINGRMPEVLVHHIRFNCEGKASELAKVYHTTPGKISDIQKCAGFKYITEDFKPTQDQVDKGLEWADKMEARGDDVGAEDLRTVLNGTELASEADVEAYEAAKASTRKPRGKSAKEAEAVTEDAVDVDDDDGLGDLT